VTTPPALSAIPAFPALSERAAGTYNANAYACLNHWATTGGPQLAALANNVAGNATDAAGSASSAAAAKNDAESAATNAAGSVLLAYNWAVKTDGPVSGGEYSARYWAQQAAAVVATIPTGTINDGTTSGTSVWSSSKVSTELAAKAGITATQTLTNKTLTAAVLNGGYTEQVFTLTGTTPALDEANGSIQTWTLSGNSTPTDSLSSGQSIILGITAGANTVTWPSVTWSKVGGSGAAPTLTSSGVNWVILWKVSTVLRGAFLGTA